jgi:quinohemoprotein ethanol dehydrogenase
MQTIRSSAIHIAGSTYLVVLLGLCVANSTHADPDSGSAGADLKVSAEISGKASRKVSAKRLRDADAEPGSWLNHGRSQDEARFSPLSQIDRTNVAQLGLAWSAPLGTKRGMEATPLVADGVLYSTGSWSLVYAHAARSGRELWRFDPKVPRWKGRYACCDVVNRGVALYGNRVYLGTIDGRLIALDARTGEPVFDVMTVDPDKPYTITGAPRIAAGLVIIGNGGADLGVRGYFSAYDPDTGALVWRFYTVPASKKGPHESPAVAAAAKTWSAESRWEAGLGGTVWDAFAYDPELDLLYAGVGNSAIYERALRSPGGGDNLYLASILAVRPKTGELVWHYQTTPGESWDYTATQHMILADLEIEGRKRKVLMQAPKNGFFYVLDRETGELLSAETFVSISWATHVDMQTGRPVERAEATWTEHDAIVAPGPMGGHNWHPMSFSPRTGLVYIPSASNAYIFAKDQNFTFLEKSWNTGEDLARVLEDGELLGLSMRFCNPSHITAWDPVKAKQVWRVNHESPVPGGLLSTAGNLIFQGRGDGAFDAYDAATGERLWSSNVRIGIMAPPISYAIDGEQYVAVVTGAGGSHGGHTAVLQYENDGHLLAYKLGGKAPLPTATRRAAGQVHMPAQPISAELEARGRAVYGRHCIFCHGVAAESSGLVPDLRHASLAVHEDWNAIVLGGTRQSRGMPSFADHLSQADAQAVRAYVIARATRDPGLLGNALRFASRYMCVPSTWIAD